MVPGDALRFTSSVCTSHSLSYISGSSDRSKVVPRADPGIQQRQSQWATDIRRPRGFHRSLRKSCSTRTCGSGPPCIARVVCYYSLSYQPLRSSYPIVYSVYDEREYGEAHSRPMQTLVVTHHLRGQQRTERHALSSDEGKLLPKRPGQ